MKIIDLTGRIFGRLTVLKRVASAPGQVLWLCRCSCGNEKVIRGSNLRQGNTRSCGCLNKEAAAKLGKQFKCGYKHGCFGTKLYGVWAGMKRRCYNSHTKYYSCYGGRGIKMCEEWKNDFVLFKDWALANGYAEGLSIERVNVDSDYCPENCRFIPLNKQGANRRSTIKVMHNGKEYTLQEIADITGLKYRTVSGRYERGLTPEQIFDTKLHKNKYA